MPDTVRPGVKASVNPQAIKAAEQQAIQEQALAADTIDTLAAPPQPSDAAATPPQALAAVVEVDNGEASIQPFELMLAGPELLVLRAAVLGWRAALVAQSNQLSLERSHPNAQGFMNPRPGTIIEGEIAQTLAMIEQLDAVATKLGVGGA